MAGRQGQGPRRGHRRGPSRTAADLRRRIVRAAAAGTVLAVALAGCTDEDALRRQRLDEATAATLDATLAFTLQVEATEEALAAIGADVGVLGPALSTSRIGGVLEGERAALGLELAGVDLFQVRVLAPGEQYLRFDLGSLLTLVAGGADDLERDLDEALADEGLDEDVRASILAAARGDWVRLEQPATDGPSVGTSLTDALRAVLSTATPTDHIGDLDAAVFDGQFDVEVDLARTAAVVAEALAGVSGAAASAVPSPGAQRLDGRVLVDEGIVRTIVLELGALAEGTPDVELVLDMRPITPAEPLVVAPPTSVSVTLEQLTAATALLPVLRGSDGPESP